MNKNYAEEEHIGKAIIDQYFTRTRLTQKQSGHRLWINKEVQQPPDLEQSEVQQEEQSTQEQDTIQPPPGLEQPATYTYIHRTPKAMARESYKPQHRLTGKQPPPIVAQLDGIAEKKKTITLENNEDEGGENPNGDNYEGRSGITLVAVWGRHYTVQ
eukprot:1649624-Amphidinium_carterae.3